MFNLNEEIAEWRRQMLAAGIETPVPLNELESHLREDVEQQMRSGLAELGVRYEIAERVIGHAMPQLERTYNVFAYREEKRSALELWARHLTGIVTDGRAAPNVVELRSGT